MNSKTNSGKNGYTNKYELLIQIGSICCKLVIRNREFFEDLRNLYYAFIVEGTADITIELDLTDKINPDDFREVLYNTVYTHDGGRFWTTTRVASGQYDLSSRYINITAERTLGDTDFEYNHLNRLIAMAYYSGCKIKHNGSSPPGLLVHACGIIRNGKMVLFAGPSEIGKTTIARFCGDRHGDIVNDEMILVSRKSPDNPCLQAQGAPIIGKVPQRKNTTAELSYILLLKQSSNTKINELDKAEVYLRLIRQVINPAYIGQRSGRDVYSVMADFSAELVENVPVYELEFKLDEDTLWETIDELEKRLRKDECKCP